LQTLILEAFTHAFRLPKFLAKNFPGAHAVVNLSEARAIIKSSLQPPRCRRVLPRASTPLFTTIVKPLYAPPSSSTLVGDTVDHADTVPKPVMPFPSPQQRHPPRARDNVHPEPFPRSRHRWPAPSLGPQCRPPPRACDAVIPAMSPNSRHHRTRAIPKPATPSSSPSVQGYIVYFSLPF
jgi:hypothetical protein